MGVMDTMRRTLFGLPTLSNDAKRASAWADYGYPEHLGFDNYYAMFCRGGIARAGVMRHVEKSWETNPWIVEGEEGDKPRTDWSEWELTIARLCRELQLWGRLSAADWRNRVGRYAGLYLTFGDGLTPDQPVTHGAKLIKVKPLFESQLEPSAWNDDPASPEYGQPSMYQLKQSSADQGPVGQTLQIHPDRVHIIAEGADDDSIYGTPALEPGFNSLLDIEKIRGAGGEGFWKAARGAWSLEGEADAQQLATMLGVPQDQVAEALNDTAADFAAGMDKLLMLGGMTAKSLTFTVPDPQKFFDIAAADFAASVSCPLPILLGQQISQRSSDENAREWQQTIMSRRRQFLGPNIESLVRHLMRLGTLPARDRFYVAWDDLTDATATDKLDNAKSMSETNRNNAMGGLQPSFTENEIREAAGLDADASLDGGLGYDEDPAADPAEE